MKHDAFAADRRFCGAVGAGLLAAALLIPLGHMALTTVAALGLVALAAAPMILAGRPRGGRHYAAGIH